MNNQNTPFKDKEMLADILSTQKHVTSGYNTSTNECACAELRDEFLDILNEEHEIQADVFYEMQSHGWYPTQPADTNQVNTTKQKFATM